MSVCVCVCCSTVGKFCNLLYKHPRKTVSTEILVWNASRRTDLNDWRGHGAQPPQQGCTWTTFLLWYLSALERAKRDGVTQAWYTWSCWLMARFPNPTQHNQSDSNSKHTLSLCVHLPTLPWLHCSFGTVDPPFLTSGSRPAIRWSSPLPQRW